MSNELERHFVTVGGRFGPRQVHYRRGGQGPAVLLLHQSPQSSRELEPLIAAWGDRFTLIAPDSPGYGLSDPLRDPGRNDGGAVSGASIDDFAAAVLEFADAIGLRRFAAYGFHTGASIGTALARQFPGRITGMAANGLVVLTDPEIELILRDYLPPLEPRWDGGHLAWLWGRMREQSIFFPWHDRRAATRMDFDVPPPDRLHLGLQEFLAASDHYAVAYRAAFVWRAERQLPGIDVPLLVTASARDPLAGHLDRIGDRGRGVRVERSADAVDALGRCLRHLEAHPGDPAPPPPAVAYREAPNCYAGRPGQQVRLRVHGSPPASATRRVILLPAPGRSAAAVDPLAREVATALGTRACVIGVDLPGHGASDSPTGATTGSSVLAASMDQIAAALATLPADAPFQSAVLGLGHGAPLAPELAGRLGEAVQAVCLAQPAWSPDDIAAALRDGLPLLTPQWSGGHLLEAWHMVRDGRLFEPWFRRERAGIRRGEPDLDDRTIQAEVTDLLRASGAWQPLMREILQRSAGAGGRTVTPLVAPPTNWTAVLFPAPARR